MACRYSQLWTCHKDERTEHAASDLGDNSSPVPDLSSNVVECEEEAIDSVDFQLHRARTQAVKIHTAIPSLLFHGISRTIRTKIQCIPFSSNSSIRPRPFSLSCSKCSLSVVLPYERLGGGGTGVAIPWVSVRSKGRRAAD